ncbi:MAG: flippase [Paludibacter sp.]
MIHKKEIWDTFYLIALQGFTYLAPLIVFPYLMITLGAEKFGYIGFSLAITQYLMLIVNFGFHLSATKRVALCKNNQTELNKVFSATLLAKLGLLGICFLILLIFAFAIPRFSIYSKTLLVLFSMVVADTFSFVWLFQGIGKIKVISIINIISKLLILPLTFIFVNKPDDYLIAAFIQSMVYLFSSAMAFYLIIRNKYITNWIKTTKEKILLELKLSYPIFLASIATSLYTAMFVIILGYFSSPSEVGKYSAADRIMRAIAYLVFVPISQSFYPKISAMSIESKKEAKAIVVRLAVFVGLVMILVSITMFFFSKYLVSFLGKDYQGTTELFKIMALIPFFIGVGGVCGQLGLLAMGDERDKKIYQRVYFAAGGVAIISIVLLIPQYHSIGVAIAIFLTELVVFVGMAWRFKRLVNRDIIK